MLSRSRSSVTRTLAAVLLASTAAVTLGQRPALTKSVDEPGRTPYFDQQVGTCNIICVVTFKKVVPAGFRLVVTHASVSFHSFAVSDKFVILQQSPLAYQEFLPAPGQVGSFSGGENSYIASSPVVLFVEAGSVPELEVNRGTGAAFASVSGYLVAIP